MDTTTRPRRGRLRALAVTIAACLAVPLLGTAAQADGCSARMDTAAGRWTVTATGCTPGDFVVVETNNRATALGVATDRTSSEIDVWWGGSAQVTCSAAWTCSGPVADASWPASADYAGERTVARYDPSWTSLGLGSYAPGSDVSPGALSALDDSADGTLWSGLQDGMHDPIMQGVFPLAVVSLAAGLLLVWVRRAVRA